jgi:hypothetical protein
MSCYVVAHDSAAPNAPSFHAGKVIADVECHVLSSWLDSSCITFNQPCALSTQAGGHSIEARREAMLN